MWRRIALLSSKVAMVQLLFGSFSIDRIPTSVVVHSFVVVPPTISQYQNTEIISTSSSSSWSSLSSSSLIVLNMATKRKKRTKKKESFAEKQKRRAEKRMRQVSTPPPLQPSSTSDDDDDDNTTTKEEGDSSVVSSTNKEESPEMKRAAKLIEEQRKSVHMLTHVKECVESLPHDEIVDKVFGLSSSSTEGGGEGDEEFFFVYDDFLNDDELISEIENEGYKLLKNKDDDTKMELGEGLGEYVIEIKGGEEQYVLCPRTVEFVVSITKHMTNQLNTEATTRSDEIDRLDDTASMGLMRTFDRKSKMAALSLLKDATLKDSNNSDDDDDLLLPQRPFRLVTNNNNNDDDENNNNNDDDKGQRLTLYYWPLPKEWDGKSCGASITFKSKRDEDFKKVIEAKRDRLILLKSDTCLHRKDPWKGSKDGVDIGSCIELHLIKKKT